MFEAGLGTDLRKLRKTGAQATFIACAGVFVPMIFGTLLFLAFYGISGQILKALFIGTIMSATSVSITVAALKELGRLDGIVGTTITSAAIIDDVIGMIVLTFLLGMTGGSDENSAVVIGKSVLFFVLAVGTGFLVYKIFSWLDKRHTHTRRIPIVSLCYCFLMAYVAETGFGIADITGAYVAGVVLCNLSDAEYIERRVDISSYMVFAPLFFTGIGLKTSFAAMDMKLLFFSVCFVLTALFGKIIGCGLCAKMSRFNRHDAYKIGLGMMTRGEVALITAQKGLAAGLLTSEFFTPVILLILASSIITPILLKREYNKYPTD